MPAYKTGIALVIIVYISYTVNSAQWVERAKAQKEPFISTKYFGHKPKDLKKNMLKIYWFTEGRGPQNSAH